MKIGFKDKNNKDLCVGQIVRTFDSKGKKWIGQIVPVDPKIIVKSAIVERGGVQYAFRSNYETWINNQGYASTLEILK